MGSNGATYFYMKQKEPIIIESAFNAYPNDLWSLNLKFRKAFEQEDWDVFLSIFSRESQKKFKTFILPIDHNDISENQAKKMVLDRFRDYYFNTYEIQSRGNSLIKEKGEYRVHLLMDIGLLFT